MGKFTHFNEQGHARMVDVTEKAVTMRTAEAEGFIEMRKETLDAVRTGQVKKGDVLAVAQVAGIMAAKRTSDIIPMCHTLTLTGVDINFELSDEPCGVRIRSAARCKGETGVEMEALTAVSAAALTIYDMCKALERGMCIRDIRLISKSGGASGDYRREML